jgi:hypothetical protein
MSNLTDKLALTINQKNHLAMLLAVIALCDIRTAITAVIAAFAGTLEELRALTETIIDTAKQKSSVTVGTVNAKDKAEDTLLDVLMQVAGALLAYASKNKLTAVKDLVNVKRWWLAALPDVELQVKAASIAELAVKYATEIAAFGATAAKVAALQTAVAEYKKAVASVNTGKSVRSGSVQSLKNLFLEADTLLKEQLDKMVDNLQSSQPIFYTEYQAARVIHDVGGSQPEETPAPAAATTSTTVASAATAAAK